uniref:Uncharacterized protein n=1 Tax=Avena sativa TaxID=4498 RepID=A0ACD6ACT9_AVESA
MRTVFIIALTSLAATNAVQLDTACIQGCGQCQQQQQQWHQWMNTCSSFLQQCSPMMAPVSQMWETSSCQMMQQRCCQQLAQISELARCQAICGVTQAIMQQQPGQSFDQPPQQLQFELMRMTIQTLPSICNVYIPEYCTAAPCNRITPSPYRMPMAATCAGGACC